MLNSALEQIKKSGAKFFDIPGRFVFFVGVCIMFLPNC